MKKIPVTYKIDVDILRKIDEINEETGIPKVRIVENALRKHLMEEVIEKPKSIVKASKSNTFLDELNKFTSKG